MLGLKLATDPRWVDIAEKNIDEILIDHAYCEQKAASTGISLIVRFADLPDLVDIVSPVVAEEWGHFRKVIKEIENRGYKLGLQRKDEYVNELLKLKRKGGSRLDQLLEELMICAMIEARSCERFRLLSLEISDLELRSFYHEFMVSEAGHYTLFIELAKKYIAHDKVKKRWDEFVEQEAQIMKNLELRDKIH